MRGSLQEQLLNAGLVSKEKLEKSRKKPVRNKPKSTKKPIKSANAGRSQSNKSQNPKPTEKKPIVLGKEIRTEIKKILRANKVNDKEGEIVHNYIVENQVKRVYINKELQNRLLSGELCIVNWNDRSYLIPVSTQDPLKKLHPELPFYTFNEKTEEKSKNPDDPYADFEIPDDLSW